MKTFIILFGLFVFVMAGVLVARPKEFTSYMLRHAGETWMHVGAVAVRLVLGAVLILYASQSRFPQTLQILGWIALIAGVVLILVPPGKFKQLIEWAFERLGSYTRIVGLFAVLFGGFLIYAVT